MTGQRRKTVALVAFALMAMVSCTHEEQRRPLPSRERLIDYNRQLVSRDSAFIVGFCHQNGLDSIPSSDGLWMTIIKKGDGKMATKGAVVTIAYTIADVTGEVYYTSAKDGTKTFEVGSGSEIMALDLAMPRLSKGAVATMVVMPDLAYGLHGDEERIGRRRILRYDLEVLDIN